MESSRIKELNQEEPDDGGTYVLYWMQQAQRTEFNHALEHAIRIGNDRGEPVVIGFGLTADYPEANERHYAFMLQGLVEVEREAKKRGLKCVVRLGSPDEVALELAQDASVVVCDRGYLRHQRSWRRRLAREAKRPIVQVESDVVVPVDEVSSKAEYAARTIRPKIHALWDNYLGGLSATKVAKSSLRLPLHSDVSLADLQDVLDRLDIDRSVGRVSRFVGGTSEARKRLRRFLTSRLQGYETARNDPSDPQCSNLSPYLHFGQISPVEVARKAKAAQSGSDADVSSFLEELIVRRELAINFVCHEPSYDKFRCLPSWARETLSKHRNDPRPHLYRRDQLERGSTHDPYWNAAMGEMVLTGYMHNYMRMYWGKKILEWSPTPERAYATTLSLNNKYFLDGRDPNSFANVAWIFGLHDRPWSERDVFGTVRFMSEQGLRRKFDIDRYVRWVDGLRRA